MHDDAVKAAAASNTNKYLIKLWFSVLEILYLERASLGEEGIYDCIVEAAALAQVKYVEAEAHQLYKGEHAAELLS